MQLWMITVHRHSVTIADWTRNNFMVVLEFLMVEFSAAGFAKSNHRLTYAMAFKVCRASSRIKERVAKLLY